MAVKMTKADWIDKGKKLFGEDQMKWEFVCPGCGHVQKVDDFKQYKDHGAHPASAYQECIGRYTGGASWTYGGKTGKLPKGGPCDYAGYGLLRISPVTVVDEDGKEILAFAFNEGDKTEVP